MKCDKCKGRGIVYDYSSNMMDGCSSLCDKCGGTGEVYSDNDPQPWDLDHPRWGRFTSHLNSKWKTRFVLTGSGRDLDKILTVLKATTGFTYRYIQFDEEKLFPGQDRSYMIPCVYFFRDDERQSHFNVTSEELSELYWY